MTIKFETFTGKAPTIEAVFLSEENIDEIAAWLGADGYTLEKTLKGNHQEVTFTSSYQVIDGKLVQRNNGHAERLVRAIVGKWLVRYPERVNEHGSDTKHYFYSLSQEEVDKFISQQLEKGEVDIDPPRSYY